MHSTTVSFCCPAPLMEAIIFRVSGKRRHEYECVASVP